MTVPPLSARHLLTHWSVEPGAAVAVATAAVLYAGGVRRLAGRGRRWPAGRSVAFAAGLALVAVATQSALAEYDTLLFSVHVVQHLLLGMAAPLLLALGAPVTLALQVTRGDARQVVLGVVHGPVAAAITHPAVAAALVSGSLFGLYLTPLLRLSLENEAVHAAVHLHFLVAGCAFFWPLLGFDVGRRRLPHPLRIVAVFSLVPVHAVLGVAILSSRRLLGDGWYGRAALAWGTDALADQRVGGGLLWVTGDLVGLAATALVLIEWMRHDERQAAREDRRLDALAAAAHAADEKRR